MAASCTSMALRPASFRPSLPFAKFGLIPILFHRSSIRWALEEFKSLRNPVGEPGTARSPKTTTAPSSTAVIHFLLHAETFSPIKSMATRAAGSARRCPLLINADFRDIANSSVIAAQIIGPPTFTPQSYNALFPLPQYRLNVGPRLDWQVSKNNTLTVRYQYERNSVTNSGVGKLRFVPVQASNQLQSEDQLQVTDTQYIGKRVIYETHFQYLHQPTSNVAANLIPSINVPGDFTGGGSGNSFDACKIVHELQSFALRSP